MNKKHCHAHQNRSSFAFFYYGYLFQWWIINKIFSGIKGSWETSIWFDVLLILAFFKFNIESATDCILQILLSVISIILNCPVCVLKRNQIMKVFGNQTIWFSFSFFNNSKLSKLITVYKTTTANKIVIYYYIYYTREKSSRF